MRYMNKTTMFYYETHQFQVYGLDAAARSRRMSSKKDALRQSEERRPGMAA